MGNKQPNEKIFEQEEQKDTICIMSVEDYWNFINQINNKMLVLYWGDGAIKDNANKINTFIFNSDCTLEDKIRKIIKFENTILSFFKKCDKHNYDKLWKDYIKTYFDRRTGTVSPILMILLIDSFIDDKYNEIAFGPEELAKQSQNIYIQLNYFLKHIWTDGWVTKETINFMKVIKVYLLL